MYDKFADIQTKLFTQKSQVGICFDKLETLRDGKVRGLFFRKPIKNNISSAKTLIPKPDYMEANIIDKKAINMYGQLKENPSVDNINKFTTLANRAIDKMKFVIEHEKKLSEIREVSNDDASEKSNDEE